jgi:type II secretory pathway pseudopilin PulG
MVAIAILLIILSGLLTTFVYCIVMNEANNNLVVAANDAQYVMEKIKSLGNYSLINNSTLNSLTLNFNNNLPNENLTNSYVTGTGPKEITINVNWTERGRQRNFQLSTLIASDE